MVHCAVPCPGGRLVVGEGGGFGFPFAGENFVTRMEWLVNRILRGVFPFLGGSSTGRLGREQP